MAFDPESDSAMTRLPEVGPDRGPRNILDLRPLAILHWENEGSAVPESARPIELNSTHGLKSCYSGAH